MLRSTILGLCTVVAICGSGGAQTREEKVRNDKRTVEAGGFWIYNDLAKGIAEAKVSGKPIVVVLRCIPCEECVKLDDDLVNQDPRVRPLLDKFVRVRIVSTNGLDLSLFQFDTDQSFAVFFINPDGTVYGRYGTRSHRTSWSNDVSIEGLAAALEGALELHRDYPSNKADLAPRRGPAPLFPSPEKFPSLSAKYQAKLDYEGKVVASCIHCHQIGDAVKEHYRGMKQPMPETVLFPYPHPKSLGLILDPKTRATVAKVEAGSLAEAAGFQANDKIVKFGGQPLLSIADAQWVLHNADPAGADVAAVVDRGGKAATLTLKLPKGWRQKDDISWRSSSWGLRRMATGGMLLENDPAGGLRVKHVGQFGPHAAAKNAGVLAGDQIVSFDGRSDFTRETDLLAHSLTARNPGDVVPVVVRRAGKTLELKLPMQK